jgi:hypothetical protein
MFVTRITRHLGILVHAQYNRVLGPIQVQTHGIVDLLDEGRAVGAV